MVFQFLVYTLQIQVYTRVSQKAFFVGVFVEKFYKEGILCG